MELDATAIVQFSKRYLSLNGVLSIVIPVENEKEWISFTSASDLQLIRKCQVLPTPSSSPKRLLLEYSPQDKEAEESTITLEITRHSYTNDYKLLTQDFYLEK